jgi:hypothetical protein
MKLVYVVLDAGLGGHTRTAVTLASGMRSRGHNIRFLIGETSPDAVVRAAGFEPILVRHRFRTDLEARIGEEFHTIHLFSTLGLVESMSLGIRRNKPVIYTRCGGPPVREPLELKLMRRLNPPLLTCLSAENQAELRELCPAADVQIITARIETGELRARQNSEKWLEFRRKHDIEPDAKIILRIARIGPAYTRGILDGIDAAGQLRKRGRKVTFVHIGYADVPALAEQVRERCAELPFAVSDETVAMDAQSYLGMADAIFGMGRTAFEALAVGCPLFLVNKDGYSGLVQKNNIDSFAEFNFSGRNAAPIPEAKLADDLERVLFESGVREDLAALGTDYADRFLDVRHSLAAYEALYDGPARLPAASNIRSAMPYAVAKRGLRAMMSKSFRAQLSARLRASR